MCWYTKFPVFDIGGQAGTVPGMLDTLHRANDTLENIQKVGCRVCCAAQGSIMACLCAPSLSNPNSGGLIKNPDQSSSAVYAQHAWSPAYGCHQPAAAN